MPRNEMRLDIDTSALKRAISNMDGNVADAIAKAAFMVEGRAKAKAPVDTGALRASIYTSIRGEGRADGAQADASALNPSADTDALPVPKDGTTAYVGPSVEYAAAIEMGSGQRAARPFLLPAVRETEAEFRKLLEGAVTDA